MSLAATPPQTDPLDELRGDLPAARTLSAAVAHQLGRLIVEGKLEPGAPLRLRAIADRMGTSVQPVREALRSLAADGLVSIEPHRGAFVERLSIEDVEELFAVRVALEGLAAKVATARLSASDRVGLEHAFDAMSEAAQADDQPAFIAADRAFHLRLYEATGRPRLVARILDLWDASNRARPFVYAGWLPIEDALADHRPLMNAILRADAAAAEAATRLHLEGAARRVLDAVQERE